MIRVLVVDDNPVIRHGLTSLLRTFSDIIVAGEASSGRQALDVAAEVRPDVVLLDVRMPGGDGVSAATELSGSVRVMMLTYSDDEETVTSAIRAGASGYLVHGRFSPEELGQAVRDVAGGAHVLSPAVAPAVFEALRREPRAATGLDDGGLTERECDIMQRVSRGRANAVIAAELCLSEKTVKNHINRIYAKLGVRTRAEAIATWLGVAGRR
ncbi:MAG TPA: response regulator transcription factor [Acidimicrobiales bacterium]|nr:response regulator transcription factor [Acidimicrobiales bacterium]